MPVQSVLGVMVAVLLVSMAESMFFPPKALEPDSPHVCTFDDLTLKCTYTGLSADPTLVFKDSEPPSQRANWTQTGLVASYVLSNISAEDNYLNILCCQENCTNILGAVLLRVYSQPIPLQDIHCEVYNYQKNMTCTWSLGQKYIADNLPTIDCKFRLPALSASWTDCTLPKYLTRDKNVVTVVFKETTAGDFSMKPVQFMMTVASQCGKNVSEVYNVTTKDIVRPAPATDLRSVVINSTCIEWSYIQEEAQYPKKYNRTVSSWWNDRQVFTGVTNATHNIQLVCNLHPYTEYTMTVELHPEREGYWSKPVFISNKTLQSAPSSSPKLICGSYYWNPQNCRDGNHRDLTVYWQDIPDIHKNGEISYFNVTLTPLDGGAVISESDVASMFRQKTFTGLRVRCDTDYTVSVTAYTNKGPSPVNYTIQVAKFSTGLPQPAFWAEIVNQTYVVNGTQIVAIHLPQVYTDVQDKLQVQSYTVCYCRKSMGNCQNNVPMNCSYADGSEDTVNVTVKFPAEDYLYGVSMTTPLGDSGLMWQGCPYFQNAVPTKPPLDLTARTGADDNTIMVLWSPLPCESGQPYIDSYTIQYCPVENSDMPCSGSCKERRVPGTVSSYTIEDLYEDQTYCFTVMGVSPVEHEGPASKPAYAVAKNNDLKPGQIAGIVIGGLFVMTIIGGAIFFVLRNCGRKVKVWKRQKMEVTIPDMLITGKSNAVFDNSGDQPGEYEETDVEYDIVASKSDVEAKAFENGKKPGFQRQVSKDSGVEDPESPKPLPDGYCRVASPGLPTVPEDTGGQRETGPIGHVAQKLIVNMNQAVTVGRVEMGSMIGLPKEVKDRVESRADSVKEKDETRRKVISMHSERSDSGIDTSKSKARMSDDGTVAKALINSDDGTVAKALINSWGTKHDSGFKSTSYYRQSGSSGETDLKQRAINTGHSVNLSSTPLSNYVPVPTTECHDAFDSWGHNQKRNIHNLKLNLNGGSGIDQSSDPSIPNADYVVAINGETTKSPQLVQLQCVPMPDAFKITPDQRPESLIEENNSFNLGLDSSGSASHLSQSLSSSEQVSVESNYMRAGVGPPEVSSLAGGYVTNGAELNNVTNDAEVKNVTNDAELTYVTNGAELKNGDNFTYNMGNPINNMPGQTNYVSTTDGIISNDLNEASRRRQSSGCSGGSDSTDSGVNSDRANGGSQRSSLSDSEDESNFLPTREFQPDKSGYVLAAHMDQTVRIN